MTIVERYLLLSLRLGSHIEGFVDFYYGLPNLDELVKGEEPPPPGALADESRELARSLGDLGEPQRERWLAAQLEGLAAVAERLDGSPPWDAFNYYLGGRRSRVALNSDVPLRAEAPT